ncbi:MAG: TolC family outer membrane protein [Burkholderiaceae bacterium]|jgi:outer membrane protein|nr:TolC family outer membrane protein [Burkholderiaceae bacterium]
MPAQAQSLLDLYQAARSFDAPYQSAQAQLQASQARVGQARAALLPQISLQAGAQRSATDLSISGVPIPGVPDTSSSRYNTLNAGLNGTQPLYRPVNGIGWDQSRKQFEQAQAQLIAAEQDLIVRLSQAYFDVLAAADSLLTVRAQKKEVEQQLQSAQRNFKLGNATITDSREAQSRFDLVVAQEIGAENDLHVKQLALDQLTGRPNSRPHPLAQPITLPSPQPDNVDAWVSRAVARHPSVLQNRMALDIASMEIAKAKAGHLPTLDLQANLGQQRYPDGNGSVATPGMPAMAQNTAYHTNTASIGLVFNWSLFTGLSVVNRVREAQALQDKARSDLANTERTVSQAARAAFFGVQSGLSQVRAYEAAEQSSLTSLQANQLGYKVGARINIDVLNAQSQLYQTRRDLAKARYDVLTGLLRLQQAAGTLKAADLEPINRLLEN